MGTLGGLSPQGSVAVGILVGLISTSLQAIGLTLQRKSHLLEDEKYSYDMRRPPYKRRRWQLGMFMFVLSNIVGSTIQLTTLPLPVLSTLQAAGLVFNTIFATLILGEAFTRYSFMGTVLVCIGAVMIAIFGAIGEPAHSLDQLLTLLARPAFLRWMAGTAVIVVVTLAGARFLKLLSAPARSRGWSSKLVSKLAPKLAPKLTLPPTISLHSPRLKALRGVLYGAVSGILSAHSLLVAKSAVELLVRTIIDGVNQFNRWQSWVILLGLIALALTQLYYMHRGLKLCTTSILYPFVFCIYNIIAILDGLIYFHQSSKLTALHAGLIALGTVVLLSGVLCLSWRLEEIPGHTAPVPPPTTPLTPGMGVLEEQRPMSPTLREFLYEDDQEAALHGEEQPLLQAPQGTPASAQRYTFPRTSPIHRRSTTTTPSTETAQIWAELEDDDDEIDLKSPDTIPAAPFSPSSPLRRFHRRQRAPARNRTVSVSTTPSSSKLAQAKSPTNGHHYQPSPLHRTEPRNGRPEDEAPNSAGPLSGATWARRTARFLPQFQRPRHRSTSLNIWRRTSTPLVAESHLAEDTDRQVHRDVSATPAAAGHASGQGDTPDSAGLNGAGTHAHLDDTREDHALLQHGGDPERTTRNPLQGALDVGRRWFSGWVNPRGK